MYCFKLEFSPAICPEMELLDHMVTVFFNFLRTIHTVFHSGYTGKKFLKNLGEKVANQVI